MIIIPALDLRGGQVVRLRQGDYKQETQYTSDALAQAKRYALDGATWMHLVDLDGARSGKWSLHHLVREIKTITDLKIQTGGGIRDEGQVQELLSMGIDRVVIGSVAAKNPMRVANWLEQFGPEKIVLALDVRFEQGQWQIATEGWLQNSSQSLKSLLDFYLPLGLKHVLCTDIHRDGMLSGLNFDLYQDLQKLAPTLQIQCSGGVRDLDDVRIAKQNRHASVILGRALLEGKFSVRDALAC